MINVYLEQRANKGGLARPLLPAVESDPPTAAGVFSRSRSRKVEQPFLKMFFAEVLGHRGKAWLALVFNIDVL